MQQSSIKTTAISILVIFLGFVSRDLNAHHQTVAFNSTPQETRTLSAAINDLFYAEPTLTFKQLQ